MDTRLFEVSLVKDTPFGPISIYRGRDCLCQRCSDDCITVTGSEYCGECEVSYHLRNEAPCH